MAVSVKRWKTFIASDQATPFLGIHPKKSTGNNNNLICMGLFGATFIYCHFTPKKPNKGNTGGDTELENRGTAELINSGTVGDKYEDD